MQYQYLNTIYNEQHTHLYGPTGAGARDVFMIFLTTLEAIIWI